MTEGQVRRRQRQRDKKRNLILDENTAPRSAGFFDKVFVEVSKNLGGYIHANKIQRVHL